MRCTCGVKLSFCGQIDYRLYLRFCTFIRCLVVHWAASHRNSISSQFIVDLDVVWGECCVEASVKDGGEATVTFTAANYIGRSLDSRYL